MLFNLNLRLVKLKADRRAQKCIIGTSGLGALIPLEPFKVGVLDAIFFRGHA